MREVTCEVGKENEVRREPIFLYVVSVMGGQTLLELVSYKTHVDME